MVKIIHAADLHLGSKLSSLPKGDIKDNRKKEILKSFNRLIDYACNNDIHIILFSGDVFDSDRPSKKDKDFFYGAIKAHPEITFLYLKGNHDIEESLVEKYDNLFLFNDDNWSYYRFGSIVISGIELSANNKSSLYSSLSLNSGDINITMLHGDIHTKGKEFIDIKKLANKNINYLALGHIHSYEENKIDNRGVAIYSGCLDGRGFDELGNKGFVLLEIDEKTMQIRHQFIPFSSRIIKEIEVDISSANDLYSTQQIVKTYTDSLDKDLILKIILKGTVNFDVSEINEDIYQFFKDSFYHLKVESELKQTIDINSYKNDFSLKGEFIRLVNNDEGLKEEEKQDILNIALKVFNGEKLL